MKIRIIKNAYNLKGKIYSGRYILEKEYETSEYDGINIVRYYLYDSEKNIKEELLPQTKKYDILKIESLNKNSDFLFFTTITEEGEIESKTITLNKLIISSKEIIEIYKFKDDLLQYIDYKRIRVFILNDYYVLLQKEFIRYNLTETYKGYFEFELYLYSIKDKKTIKVVDENLNSNGIETLKLLNNNMCILKTGFNLIKDNRYKILEKNEVSIERISFINIGQLISDILLMQKNIVLDTIDQAFYTETFTYVSLKDNYIVYSKVKNNIHEEEVVFYNYQDKQTTICINQNIFEEKDLAWTYVIGKIPYVRIINDNGTQFYNLIKHKVDIEFQEGEVVEIVVNDLFIVSSKRKGILGKETDNFAVYRYPNLEMIHREKGQYIGCIATDKSSVYILTK